MSGELPSFLQPLERRIPMVATEDVGRVAAGLLCDAWSGGQRVVELAGPTDLSPRDLADALSRQFAGVASRSSASVFAVEAAGRLMQPVHAVAVPRADWEGIFRSQGMRHPQARMQMLDGFNAGWLCFEGEPQRGTIGLAEVLAQPGFGAG